MNKRLAIFITSLIIALGAGWFFLQIDPNFVSDNFVYVILALIFFAVLVSNQQFEEDNISKIERVASAILVSYIIFFHFMYFPSRQFFFGTLVTKESFPTELLALVLFGIFFFLFGTTTLVLNAYSRVGFLARWKIFNNETMFYLSRILFFPAAVLFALLIVKSNY